MKNKILSLLSALVLICSLVLNVSAAHPVPDLSRNGSITFVMNYGDVLLDGGYLNLYKVGDIAEEDGNYRFVPVEKLKGINVDLNNVTDPTLASKLVSYGKAARLSKISVPITEGRASFADLSPGLYVVWQDEEDATEGFSPIQPFLISIPRFQNGEYILDVLCDPKVPVETEPTTPPPSPPPPPTTPPSTPPPSTTPPKPPGNPPPKVPQTGQLNWPVPVMAISGCILFVLGLVLSFGRKDADDEA